MRGLRQGGVLILFALASCIAGCGRTNYGEWKYERFVSALRSASSPRRRGDLARALPRSPKLLAGLARNPDPVLELLKGAKTQTVVLALSDALSRANVKSAIPVIESKLEYDPPLGGWMRPFLDAALIRLGHPPTLSKYAGKFSAADFWEQSDILDVFVLSESPRVMKYLIPWLDKKHYPDLGGGDMVPPWRYCDVAVSFARHFRENRPGKPKAYGVPSCSDEEIEDVKRWWKTVKDTEKYR